ncbi:MAG TPA: hypothetical protein VIS03_11345 [Kiloniellaceae bacterium]
MSWKPRRVMPEDSDRHRSRLADGVAGAEVAPAATLRFVPQKKAPA